MRNTKLCVKLCVCEQGFYVGMQAGNQGFTLLTRLHTGNPPKRLCERIVNPDSPRQLANYLPWSWYHGQGQQSFLPTWRGNQFIHGGLFEWLRIMSDILQVWNRVCGLQIQFSTVHCRINRIMPLEPVQAARSTIVLQNFPVLNFYSENDRS